MKFYDKDLENYIEIREENGCYHLYIKDTKYPMSIPFDVLQQYPDWVALEVVRLMARRAYRKNKLNQLAESIILKES